MTISFRLSSNLGIFSLAFSYPLEPLVFLDNDLLSFGDFLIGFFSGFGASIFFYHVRTLYDENAFHVP